MSPPINGFDLDPLSIDELKALEDAVQTRVQDLEAARRDAAFREMEKIAKQNGLTKAEVAARFGGRRSRKPKNKVRYRNPENPAETWTGVGRKPGWVQEHFAKGGTLEELAPPK